MPDFTAHAPGTFSWVELMTTDAKAGVAFYRNLFGWDVVEHDMGPDGVYTIFTMRGRDVAAGASLPGDERQLGFPSHWNLYVAVASADEAATRAASLGAKVLFGPFDVMTHGRMAVIQDPAGAVFHVWEPKAHIGVKIRNEPGALYRVLEPFHTNGISLSRIETRPSKTGNWSYVFFIDFDGHQDSPEIRRVLDAVRRVAMDVKALGSYPQAVV